MVKENNAVYLANADGAKIQLISKDNTLHPGKVRVYGTFEKDPSNKHYPYYLKVIRITPVK